MVNNLGRNVNEIWGNYCDKAFKDNPNTKTTPIMKINLKDFFNSKEMRRLDSSTQYSIIATNEAIDRAQLSLLDKEGTGILIGASGNGSDISFLDNHELLITKGPNRVSPYYASSVMINSPPAEIAIRHKIHGPSSTVIAGEASSLLAIGHAFEMVKGENFCTMIAGGTQGDISELTKVAYTKLGLNPESQGDYQPFLKNGQEHSLGAGAGTIILETEKHALKRGAQIYGEILGFCMLTGEGTKTMKLTMEGSLVDAGIPPHKLEYIAIQGNGNNYIDEAEKKAIYKVFYPNQINIVSFKRHIGNLIAANGVTHTILSMLKLKDKIGMINAFDFNGHCASLVIKSV